MYFRLFAVICIFEQVGPERCWVGGAGLYVAPGRDMSGKADLLVRHILDCYVYVYVYMYICMYVCMYMRLCVCGGG